MAKKPVDGGALDDLIKTAGIGARTAAKLRAANAKLAEANVTSETEATPRPRGHGSARDSVPMRRGL